MTFLAPTAIVCAALLALGACGGKQRAPTARRGGGDLDDVERVSRDELEADLRATVLEGYQALSRGYEEQYLDSLDQNARLVLIDVEPGDVVVGYEPVACRLRRQFPDKKMELVSKKLEIELSRSGSVGWTFDDLSYRVTHDGRRAAIPLRATGVYERLQGRWIKVMEHVSYGVPDDEARLLLAARKVPPPLDLGDDTPPGSEAAEVRAAVMKLIEAEKAPTVDDARALVVGSDPDREVRGKDAGNFATVRALYGFDWKVTPTAVRVRVARTGGVAWGAANVDLVSADGELTMPLRATWVLERGDDDVWRAVQTHVSLPVPREILAMRVFGEALTSLPRSPEPRAEAPGSPDRRGRYR